MPLRGTYSGELGHTMEVDLRISRETMSVFEQAQQQQR